MIQTQENGKKPHFGPHLSLLGRNMGCQFFQKNLSLSVTRYNDQLSSCTISEKTNDPTTDRQMERRMDGWTDRRMDRWMNRWMDRQTRVIPQDLV